MSVLHVLAPAPFGGLERVVLALAAGQRARWEGREVTVAALLSPASNPPVLEELRAAGVRVREIVTPPRSYRAQMRRLSELASELRPTVMHTHGYLPDVLVALLQPRRCPIATTVHGFTGGDLKNRLYEWLQVRAYRRFDAVVSVSEPIHARLARGGVPDRRLHVVRNAMPPVKTHPPNDARASLAVPNDVFSIGWVGRISREKGLDVLLHALSLLRTIPFRATVVGDGPERSQMETLTRDLGLADRVHFAGVIPESGRLMRAFDVLVLSSRTEGTPITLLEAMSATVPVVATSVGGIPYVISPVEGLLVPSEQPEPLAMAINSTFADRAAAAERARRARDRLETHFAATPWIEAYDRIYNQIHQSNRLAP